MYVSQSVDSNFHTIWSEMLCKTMNPSSWQHPTNSERCINSCTWQIKIWWNGSCRKECLKEGRANATPRWHKLWCRVTQRIIDLHQPMRSAMHGLHKWHPTLLIAEVPHPGKYERHRISWLIYSTLADIMECGAEIWTIIIFLLSELSQYNYWHIY